MSRRARPIRVEGDLAYIPLTKGYEAVIDAGDVPKVEGVNWIATTPKHHIYAMRSLPRDSLGHQEKVMMHRLILGAPEGVLVDHINGNGLDNRKSNLRLVTFLENAWNARKYKTSTTGLKGVTYEPSRQKWRARINVAGKRMSLGWFDTPGAAHTAYCDAAKRWHGEYARFG